MAKGYRIVRSRVRMVLMERSYGFRFDPALGGSYSRDCDGIPCSELGRSVRLLKAILVVISE